MSGPRRSELKCRGQGGIKRCYSMNFLSKGLDTAGWYGLPYVAMSVGCFMCVGEKGWI